MADNKDQAAIERINLMCQQLRAGEKVNLPEVAKVAVALERVVKERDALSVQVEAAGKALQEFFTLSARSMFSVPDDLFVPVQKASAILSAHAPAPSSNDSTTDPFYPEILKNPNPVFAVTGNEWEDKALTCALGLDAWAWVMMGNKPPAHFGMTMARLGQFLGCMATAEGLSEYSHKYLLGENPLPGAPSVNLREGIGR
jgi:hypothetical protein